MSANRARWMALLLVLILLCGCEPWPARSYHLTDLNDTQQEQLRELFELDESAQIEEAMAKESPHLSDSWVAVIIRMETEWALDPQSVHYEAPYELRLLDETFLCETDHWEGTLQTCCLTDGRWLLRKTSVSAAEIEAFANKN